MSIDPFGDITSYEIEDIEEGRKRMEEEENAHLDNSSDVSNVGGDFRMNRLLNANVHSDVEPPSSLTVKSSSSNTPQTGPKGVINDYKIAQRNEAIRRKFIAIQRERELQNEAMGRIILTVKEKEEGGKGTSTRREEEDEDDEDDEDLKSFQFSQYSLHLPQFGRYERISSPIEFASMVKELHEGVFVVCHLYDNSVESCIRLHFSLENIAAQFDHTKFVRGRTVDLMKNFKMEGLPALIIYKGGKLIHSAVRITDVIGEKFSDVDVAKLLQSLKILQLPTVTESNRESSVGTKKGTFKRSIYQHDFIDERDDDQD